MTNKPLKVLIVEDNDGDARLLEMGLRKTGSPAWTFARAITLKEAVEQAGKESFDVLLLDLSLPDSQGLETVDRMTEQAPYVPIVVFTGRDDDAIGMEAIQHGAQDYLLKGQADGRSMARGIRYAIERKRVRMELQAAHDELEKRVRERTAELENAIMVLGEEVSDRRHAEESLETSRQQLLQITEAIPEVIWMASTDMSVIHYVNQAYERVWGRPRDSLYAHPKSWMEGIVPEDRPVLESTIRQWLAQAGYGALTSSSDFRVCRPDGSVVHVRGRAFAIRDERGKLLSICGIVQDVAEQGLTAKAAQKTAAGR